MDRFARSAIWTLLSPWAIRAITSASRAVSPPPFPGHWDIPSRRSAPSRTTCSPAYTRSNASTSSTAGRDLDTIPETPTGRVEFLILGRLQV